MSTFVSDLFAGKTALVTGGTSGIGQATAEYLARHGAHVVAIGLGADRTAVSDGVELDLREVDVTDDKALKAVIADLDRLDILVPAAGISLGDREIEWEAFNTVLSIQLNAVYRITDLAHPLLAASQGSVINIASMYSFFGGGRRVAYSAAKGAVVQITKSLAEAWAPDGIRVNAVAPGWINTPLLATIEDQAVVDRLLSRTPLNRFGDPEEIGKAIAFLASDAASFITGVVLPVDGGYLTTGI
ncbi:NAD(P)-dependent dehydrogenase (short-subunit alcohol dehydrogenase family) [Leucobacter luti]|uniref:NAD(P)-dependent dehydrogenase (Short-subunit alcohol dehydrogenase family) n=2 Tax=Leucobacter luti TaxID=340320 RepID=A0A4Q7TWM4_9MICO|nr:SDR family oxidoreductase [Leucobacter luti]RZT64590.1 NAD(P)-dependent dehydrogenase (short-subunit alcohol dehydrogenase family) [Leucobacter luti]